MIGKVPGAFRHSAALSGESIRQGVACGNGKAVSDAAHALKSGARAIGAERLGSLCEELEASADAGRSGELPQQLARFELEMAGVQRFLDSQ